MKRQICNSLDLDKISGGDHIMGLRAHGQNGGVIINYVSNMSYGDYLANNGTGAEGFCTAYFSTGSSNSGFMSFADCFCKACDVGYDLNKFKVKFYHNMTDPNGSDHSDVVNLGSMCGYNFTIAHTEEL